MAQIQGIEWMSDNMKSFVQVTRDFVRDHPELNRLIAEKESNDRFIAWAVLDAISKFNGTPHFTFLSLDDLLAKQQQHLLLRLTVITLLESVGQLQTRNHINYSDGGINVGVSDKTPLIMQWLKYFNTTVDQLMQRAKVAINIEGILGSHNVGVHSELWAVNASYLSY